MNKISEKIDEMNRLSRQYKDIEKEINGVETLLIGLDKISLYGMTRTYRKDKDGKEDLRVIHKPFFEYEFLEEVRPIFKKFVEKYLDEQNKEKESIAQKIEDMFK